MGIGVYPGLGFGVWDWWSKGIAESPITSRAKILVRGIVLMIRRFTILVQVSSSTKQVKSIVAREK